MDDQSIKDTVKSNDSGYLFSSSLSKNPYLLHHRHSQELNTVSDITDTVRRNRSSSSRRRTAGGKEVIAKMDTDPSINIGTSYISQYNGSLGSASEQIPCHISKDNLMMRDEDEKERHDDFEGGGDDDGGGDRTCHSQELEAFSSAQRRHGNGNMNTKKTSGFHVLDIARSSARRHASNKMTDCRRRDIAEDNYSAASMVKPWKLKTLNDHHLHPNGESKFSTTKAFSLQALEEYLQERSSTSNNINNPVNNMDDDDSGQMNNNPLQNAGDAYELGWVGHMNGADSGVLYSDDDNVSVRSPLHYRSRLIRGSRLRRYLADQAKIKSDELIICANSDDHKYNDDDDDDDEDNYSSYGSKSACCVGAMPWSTRSSGNYIPINKDVSVRSNSNYRHRSYRGSSCFPYTPSRRNVSGRIASRRLSMMNARKGYYYALGNRQKWGRVNSECFNNSCTSFSSGTNSESSVTMPLMTEPDLCFPNSSSYLTDTVTEYNTSHMGLDCDRRRHYSRNKKLYKGGHADNGMMNNEFHMSSSTRCSDYCKHAHDGELGLVSYGSRVKNKRRSSSLVETGYRSLSQKHRPKAFRELIGQPMVVQTLYNAVVLGKIAPVYLFQGPRGTGKTTAARVFTAALNCLVSELDGLDVEVTNRPCGVCKECLSLNSGKNFDVREVNASGLNRGNGTELGMKTLLKHISMPPTSSRYKVFIVNDCHLLSLEAWNVFMKNLEEPPPYVVFVLITTDPDTLPRTALSCCQKFVFSKIRDVDIVSRLESLSVLEKIDVETEALQLIASRSDGSLHDAIMTLEQVSLLGKTVSLPLVQELVGLIPEDKLSEFLDIALSSDTTRTVNYIRDFMKSGVDPSALVSQLATLITDILAGKNKSTDVHHLHHVMKMDGDMCREALRILSDAEKQLRSCNDRSTWLTAAFLQFSQMGAATTTTELVSPINRNVTHDQEKAVIPSQAPKDSMDPQMVSTRKNIVGSTRIQCMGRKSEAGRFLKANLQLDVVSHNSVICSSPSRLSMGNRVYPCNNQSSSPCEGEGIMPSPKSGGRVDLELINSGTNRYSLEQNSAASVDNIWRKVLGSTRSNVIKQLLRAEGRFLSLSVSEDHSIAHLEFKHPEHKALAEKARVSIAKAFQDALSCRVELKITLAPSLSPSDIDTQKKTPLLVSKTDTKNNYSTKNDDEDRGTVRKNSYGKSPRPSNCVPSGCLDSKDMKRTTECREKREMNTTSNIDVNKEPDDVVLNDLPVSHCRISAETNINAGISDAEQMKQTIAERRESSPSLMQEEIAAIVHKDTMMDSPIHGAAGSNCCWKGSSKSIDPQVKAQRPMRMRRRGRLLLKFVPCAKGEGTLN